MLFFDSRDSNMADHDFAFSIQSIDDLWRHYLDISDEFGMPLQFDSIQQVREGLVGRLLADAEKLGIGKQIKNIPYDIAWAFGPGYLQSIKGCLLGSNYLKNFVNDLSQTIYWQHGPVDISDIKIFQNNIELWRTSMLNDMTDDELRQFIANNPIDILNVNGKWSLQGHNRILNAKFHNIKTVPAKLYNTQDKAFRNYINTTLKAMEELEKPTVQTVLAKSFYDNMTQYLQEIDNNSC